MKRIPGLMLFAGAAFASAAALAQDIGGRVWQSGTLVNVGSRLCAEAAQQGARDGVNVQQGDCRSGRGDWDVVELGPDDFVIVNRGSGRVLDVANSSRADAANVQQWSWNRSAAQRWRLEAAARGAYRIVNLGSGKCLEVQDRSLAAGANIAQYQCHGDDNQLWLIGGGAVVGDRTAGFGRPGGPLPAPGSGARPQGRTLYSGLLHSRATGKCVDVERAGRSEGADVRQWSCNGSTAQLWDVLDIGRGEVAFVLQASDRVMEVAGNTRQSGADVVQSAWNGAPSQRWRMESIEGGFSRIVSVGSGKCLDLDGARTADGTNIAQADCHLGQNQQWRMEIRGTGAGWAGYRPEQNWFAPNRRYQEEPPAFMVGDFRGLNNFYQQNILLSVYSDGVVIATLEGDQRVAGYYRGEQIYLGNGRYDVQQERGGFRLVASGQTGQAAGAVSYQRVRYESPTRSR